MKNEKKNEKPNPNKNRFETTINQNCNKNFKSIVYSEILKIKIYFACQKTKKVLTSNFAKEISRKRIDF